MSKRQADKQISHLDPDDDEKEIDSADKSSVKAATAEEIQKRVIRKANISKVLK